MVRGRDYVGNLNEIQQRFMKGNYKGGHGNLDGKINSKFSRNHSFEWF